MLAGWGEAISRRSLTIFEVRAEKPMREPPFKTQLEIPIRSHRFAYPQGTSHV